MTSFTKIGACAAALLTALGSGFAQTADAPRLGFVIDRTANRLHIILGVPGAAVVAPAQAIDASVSPQAVSPRGNYVFVLVGQDRKAGLWLPNSPLRMLDAVNGHVDRVVLSPEGTAAALYYRSENRIVTLSGLPDAPAPVASIYWRPLPETASPVFAVSDDGKVVLGAQSADSQEPAGGPQSVVVFSAAGEVNRIQLASPAIAIAFASGAHDAVVASAAQAELIRNIEIPGATIPLPVGDLGAISAAAVSRDGSQVFLASSQSEKVAVLHLDGTNSTTSVLNCNCVPTELERISDAAAYRLTAYSGNVSWILDTSANIPRILSVPTDPNPENIP